MQHSWRDHYDPHPAALVFHDYTTDEGRREQQENLATYGLQVPIVTASVEGEEKEYVVDGITRLDALEASGKETVDEHGNWLLTKNGRVMVDHRKNYTHERVANLVVSLNGTRRHMTKRQVARAIIAAVKAEAAKVVEIDFAPQKKKNSQGIARSFSPTRGKRGGSTKDPLKAEVLERATGKGISERTVEAALAEDKEKQPESKPQKPKQPKKKESFDDEVYRKWGAFLNRQPQPQRRNVMKVVAAWIEFVDRNSFGEERALKLIKKWSALRDRFDTHQREQASQLVKQWIAGELK